MSDAPDDGTFTLMDVFADAARRARGAWATHVLWNALFVALVLLSCCLSSCLVTPVALMTGEAGGAGRSPFTSVVVLYASFGVLSLLLGALHEAVTLHVSFAPERGEPASLRRALEASLRRLPALTGTVLLRTAIDLGIPVLGGGALAAVTATGIGGSSQLARTLVALAMTLVYFTSLASALWTRAHFGLAGCCAVREELGPRAALARSHALLRGRRWHFLAFRLAYFVVGFVIYCVSFAPFFAFVAATSPRAIGSSPASPTVLWVLPLLLVVYAVLLALYALDSILLASYHARLWRPVDAAAVAKVFE